jgi:pimeloyl-ACP methyl ester carboxylesterase
MKTRHIGRIVAACLVGGFVVALALVLGPVAGAQEHVVTGTILVTCAASWALLGTLSMLRTDQPQRWAFAIASFMAFAGVALLVLAPSGVVIDALGWVWPPLFLVLLTGTTVRVHRDLRSRSRWWVVYPLLVVYALGAVGGSYQTISESRDRRVYVAPGQLIDIGGHRLHLHCAGSGTPTVLLESGLGETEAYWAWISPAVARDTRVCVYDRAGRGWSDPASGPQDGVAVATDLHTLLDRARVTGPFVLVGHSSGAQYVRIFAGRYPEQVVGMVLLDGQPAEALQGLPWFPRFYRVFHRVFAVLPTLARLGVGRVLVRADVALPADARDMQRIHHASPRLYRSLRDEFDQLPTALAQARVFQSLGDRPLVVVTAAQDALAGWLPLQDRMAMLSSNSSHRVVPYTHDALVTNQTAAQTSIHAIRDVVHAVRSNATLDTSL